MFLPFLTSCCVASLLNACSWGIHVLGPSVAVQFQIRVPGVRTRTLCCYRYLHHTDILISRFDFESSSCKQKHPKAFSKHSHLQWWCFKALKGDCSRAIGCNWCFQAKSRVHLASPQIILSAGTRTSCRNHKHDNDVGCSAMLKNGAMWRHGFF